MSRTVQALVEVVNWLLRLWLRELLGCAHGLGLLHESTLDLVFGLERIETCAVRKGD